MTSIGLVGDSIRRVIHGQDEAIDLALICLLAEGHLLVEDVPGTGKTSLARALANSIGGTVNRIQFTPDLLPSDVTGISIYHQEKRTFEFHPGPIFSNIVIGDEINRASPKTQSALLEVMEEHHVTVDGVQHAVPRPFMVVATQNPIDMDGTYRLPEAQLDRFLMRISLRQLDHESEVAVLSTHGASSVSAVDALRPVVSQADVMAMVQAAEAAYVAKSLMDYIVQLSAATRIHPDVRLGVSPRGSIALLRAARARAILAGRTYATAEDVKVLALPVLTHRVIVAPQAELQGSSPRAVVEFATASVPTPEGVAV